MQNLKSANTLRNVLFVLVMSVLFTSMAHAGADTTFDGIYTTVMDWLGGSLGKLIAGVFVIIGIIAGAARQSLMAFAVGIGAAVGIANIQSILELVVGATLEHAPMAVNAVQTITNGLN